MYSIQRERDPEFVHDLMLQGYSKKDYILCLGIFLNFSKKKPATNNILT